MRFLYIFLISSILILSGAFAGNEGGGGDALQCGKSSYLADLIDSDFNWRNFHRLSEKKILEASFTYLNTQDSGLGDRVKQVIANLKIKMVKGKLEDLSDDGLKLSLWRKIFCSKRQLAIQDFTTDTVLIAEDLYLKMSKADKAFLLIHEAFISIYREEANVNGDTSVIRKRVKKAFEDKSYLKVLIQIQGSGIVPRFNLDSPPKTVSECTEFMETDFKNAFSEAVAAWAGVKVDVVSFNMSLTEILYKGPAGEYAVSILGDSGNEHQIRKWEIKSLFTNFSAREILHPLNSEVHISKELLNAPFYLLNQITLGSIFTTLWVERRKGCTNL